MDDSLLDDDDLQFKDEDNEDELDEAALLGSSDEDILDVSPSDDNALGYTETRHSPDDDDLALKSELYQGVGSGNNEEDILEVNIDADLDSFVQDDTDNNTYVEEKTKKPVLHELRYKENLIPITLISSEQEPRASKRSAEDVGSKEQSSEEFSNKASVLLDDEESEDESFDDDHRERFRSERSNIITLTPAKKRTDIPDSLESVLNSEDKSKAQEFLENERKRKQFLKSKGGFGKDKFRDEQQRTHIRGPTANLNTSPRKILINPHFGRSMPISTIASIRTSEPCSQGPNVRPNIPSNYGFQQSNFIPQTPTNLIYSSSNFSTSYASSSGGTNFPHKDNFPVSHLHNSAGPIHSHPTNTGIQPFNTTAVHFSHPPSGIQQQQHHSGNQNMPFAWCHPPSNVVTVPPPSQLSPNYIYPVTPTPAHTYSNSFNTSNYQGPFQTNVPQQHAPPKPEQFTSTTSWNQTTPKPVLSVKQNSFPRNVNLQKKQVQNVEVRKFNTQQQNKRVSQIHVRKLVKRSANFALKVDPIKLKQQRLEENTQRKVNFQQRKTNSNIKEIPLVETLPTNLVKPKQEPAPTTGLAQPIPVVDDEDEETKEYRKKIEEQKKLREQIMKQKEERRKQMALQRMQELKARQGGTIETKLDVKKRVGLPQSARTNITAKGPVLKMVQKGNLKNIQLTPAKQAVSIHERIGAKKVQPFARSPGSNAPIQVHHAKQNVSNEQTAKNPVVIKKPVQKVQITPPSEVKSSNVQRTTGQLKRRLPNQFSQVKGVKKFIMDKSSMKKFLPVKKTILEKNQFRFPSAAHVNRPQGQRMPLVRGPPPSVHPGAMPQPDWFPFRVPNVERFPAPHMESIRFNNNPAMRNRMPYIPPPPNARPEGPFHFPSRHPLCFEMNRPRMEFHEPRRFDGPPGNYRQRGLPMHTLRPPAPGFPPFMPQFQNMPRPPRMPMYPPRCPPALNMPKERQFRPPPMVVKSERNEAPQNIASSVSSIKQEKTIAADMPIKEENFKTETDASGHQADTQENSETKVKTKKVIVNNLSSSTTEGQLRKLGTTIGPIERIQLDKPDRKAVIVFKEENHASKFQMKYQRYMLDLAMIEVSLQQED